jgi:hypothetical protein
VLALARRLAGLLIVLVIVVALPLAAVRAGCVCDHGHQHGAPDTDAEPHTCTAACTAATCPMHRQAAAGHAGHASPPASEAMRCSCAGEAQALLGQASVTGPIPAVASVDAPLFAWTPRPSLVETPLRLSASPPAPPPRV